MSRLEGMDEQSVQAFALQGSHELMGLARDAFVVPETEAEKMLEGEYDDAKNMKSIQDSILKFSNLSVSLPIPLEHLVEKYSSSLEGKSFSSIEAEFTARLFKEYLRQNQGKSPER